MSESAQLTAVKPVFSERDDEAFVISYLEQKAGEELQDGVLRLEDHKGKAPWRGYPEDLPPNIRLTYRLGDSEFYENAENFGRQLLPKVFNTPMGVDFREGGIDGRHGILVSILGKTPALVSNILQNDPAVARRAATRMENRMDRENIRKSSRRSTGMYCPPK